MSAILITVSADGARIEDLPPLPATNRKRASGLTCPHCGGSDLKASRTLTLAYL